jgi:hypothetical protein
MRLFTQRRKEPQRPQSFKHVGKRKTDKAANAIGDFKPLRASREISLRLCVKCVFSRKGRKVLN